MKRYRLSRVRKPEEMKVDLMTTYDMYTGLDNFLGDGFTLQQLGKLTDTPPQMIKDYCFCDERLRPGNLWDLRYAFTFLQLLYSRELNEESYLKRLVIDLREDFKLDPACIANYMNMTLSNFKEFLKHPSDYPNGVVLTMKLMHFAVMFRAAKERY